MLFNSIPFIFIFLPIVLAGFYALGSVNRVAAQLWLCAASFFFYGWWNPIYLPLLAGSLLANFTLGRLLNDQRWSPRARRATLIVGIAGNLAVLGYFKYAAFLVANASTVAGLDWVVPSIVLPIGISFITFQKIGYLVDAYRQPGRLRYRLCEFALFVTFFPQLIAGPIVRHHEIVPQFQQASVYRPDFMRLAVGLSIFFLALFKKTVLADGLAGIAVPIFHDADAGTALAFGTAWLGAVAFTLQLYFDFSAYSELALGLAIMLGIRLPLNFASPYKSTSIVEFWRRWHISLSRFLRDYLYIALGGNRRGPVRRAVNVMVTMTLGGLWHGAGWTFVVWGALHGAFIVVNQAWRGIVGTSFTGLGRIRTVASWLVTFVAVVCGWVIFRAETFAGALAMLRAMVHPGSSMLAAGDAFGPLAYAAVLVLLVFVLVMPSIPEIFHRFAPTLEPVDSGVLAPAVRSRPRWTLQWLPTPRWVVTVGATALVGLLAMIVLRAQSQFLYFQF